MEKTKNDIRKENKAARPILRVALFRSPTANIISDLSNKFETLFDCHVIVDIYPYELLKQNIISDISQNIGDYDVFTVDCSWLAEFAEANYLESLDEKGIERKYEAEDLIKKIDTVLCKYENKRYGLPLISNIQLLAYRKDLFEKCLKPEGIRPPGKDTEDSWTWKEFIKAAHIIKDKTGLASASLRSKSPALLIYNWYPYVPSGSQAISGRLNKALKLIKSFYKNNLCPNTSIVWSHEDPVNWMIEGELAMDQTFNLEMAHWLNSGKISEKIDYAMIPKYEGENYSHPTLGGYSLGISRLSGNKDLAYKFISWATGPQIHRRLVAGGGTPCRYSELDDKNLLERFPHFKILKSGLPKTETRPQNPQWASVETLVAGEVMQYLTGQKNIKQTVAAIEKTGAQIIE